MGLVRFKLNQRDVVEDEDRTLGEVLDSQGIGRDHAVYLGDNPAQTLPVDTRVGELEGRRVGVVEPNTLG